MRRLAFLAILAAFAAHGASVSTAKYGILGLNDNVVTKTKANSVIHAIRKIKENYKNKSVAAQM